MNKRDFLVGVTGAFATGLACRDASSTEVDECGHVANPTTFVLVHGAWAGGWAFATLAQMLRERGHTVFTPTLAGLAERSHRIGPDIRLATHIEDVANVFRWHEIDSAVLVGHSYGGMVITGVADEMPERVAATVYLDAEYPEDGQAVADLVEGEALIEAMRAAEARGEFELALSDALAEAIGVPEQIRSKFTSQPLHTFLDPIALTGRHRSIATKVYVRASRFESPVLETTYERLRNVGGWRTIAVDAGHGIQEEAPERCVEILEGAAVAAAEEARA